MAVSALSPDKLRRFYASLPILHTARLLLRPLRMTDRWAIHEYISDPKVCEPMGWRPHKRLEETDSFIKSNLGRSVPGVWALEAKRVGRVIGTCGFNEIREATETGDIGYALARQFWGEGFSSEALARILQFSFEDLGLRRVEARCRPENAASLRVLAKNGFRRQGYLNKGLHHEGRFYDLHLLAINRNQWRLDHYAG
jgi:ribosomal-protein-alanine N-acetyltransferase